jgi:hypothetical protein
MKYNEDSIVPKEQVDYFWEETGQGRLFPVQQKPASGSLAVTLTGGSQNLQTLVEALALTLSRDLKRLCSLNSIVGCLEVRWSEEAGNNLMISRVAY